VLGHRREHSRGLPIIEREFRREGVDLVTVRSEVRNPLPETIVIQGFGRRSSSLQGHLAERQKGNHYPLKSYWLARTGVLDWIIRLVWESTDAVTTNLAYERGRCRNASNRRRTTKSGSRNSRSRSKWLPFA